MRLTICAAVLMLGAPANAEEPTKDEDAAKEKVAVLKAVVLVKAAETHYTQNLEWPKKLADLVPLLEEGKKGLLDPWGKEYQFKIVPTKQPDGSIIERPFIWTERIVGKELKVYGKKPPEEKKEDKKP